MTETVGKSNLGKIYDQVSAIASAFGDGQFHHGYWYDENDDVSFAEAAERITRRVSDSLGLSKDDHLLDVGCGPGAPALFIAKETGARITGISISEFEVTEAQRRSDKAGLGDRVKFEQMDYTQLSYADNTFDAVMAVESLLVAPDLHEVLTDFHRILKPGGRIALGHYTREVGMDDEHFETIKQLIAAQRLPSLQEWIDSLRRAGFKVEEFQQFGPRVFEMGTKYLGAVDKHRDELVDQFGEQSVEMFRHGLKGFDVTGPDQLGYAIVTGRKSRS